MKQNTLPAEFVSIVHCALGSDYDRLHPRIREQYGISSTSNSAFVGHGVMDKVWHGRWYMVPFLYIGSMRRILFPETGRNVPFEIHNYAYRDRYDRETVTWKRIFTFPQRQREFDEFFVFSETRGRPILYAGTHQHLAVDLHFEAADDGSLIVRTGSQRLFFGPITIPFPRYLSGDAYVRELFNEKQNLFEVDVAITNPFWGKILGYTGTFDLTKIDCPPEKIPTGVKPLHESKRE